MGPSASDNGAAERAQSAAALPFAAGIFTSAYLLFQVQPMIARYILPWFGGSPGVWTGPLMDEVRWSDDHSNLLDVLSWEAGS